MPLKAIGGGLMLIPLFIPEHKSAGDIVRPPGVKYDRSMTSCDYYIYPLVFSVSG